VAPTVAAVPAIVAVGRAIPKTRKAGSRIATSRRPERSQIAASAVAASTIEPAVSARVPIWSVMRPIVLESSGAMATVGRVSAPATAGL
jgi:hypothetical protein